MRSSRRSLSLSFLVVTCVASAQVESKTDAQADGLAGPVKSVSSTITRSGVKWEQPGGPTLVEPIWCKDCEYDPDGTKTKSGQVVEGKFFGEFIQPIRDANGHVTARFSYSGSTGELQRHEVMGPFGHTEQIVYIGGKLHWRQTFSYDQYGHMTDWMTFDAVGKSEGRVFTVTDKEGIVTRRSVYGKNGELSDEQTFDPETQVDHFTTFDEFGRVKLTWTISHGNLISFWEDHDSPSPNGAGFTILEGDGSFEDYSCHNDLSCDVSRVRYEYLDGDKHTPRSAEWRDSEGNLKLAAYFDYEVDSFRNWTYRQVWVWDTSLGERSLYETDFRIITYWPK